MLLLPSIIVIQTMLSYEHKNNLLWYVRVVCVAFAEIGSAIRPIWYAIEQISSMSCSMICIKPSLPLLSANDGLNSSLPAHTFTCKENNFEFALSRVDGPFCISLKMYDKLDSHNANLKRSNRFYYKKKEKEKAGIYRWNKYQRQWNGKNVRYLSFHFNKSKRELLWFSFASDREKSTIGI